MPLRAVLFDAYGTLFDVHSVVLAAEGLFPGHGEGLSLLWREKQIDYSRLVSMSSGAAGDHYRPFWDITRAGLRFAALKLGLALTPAAETALMDAYRRLAPFAENRAVLGELQRRGVTTGILSNGDPGMLHAAVRSAGFEPLLQHVISVDACRRYKPDPAAYALGTAALQLPARDILFVSSNGWDAIGATWFGYTTLWVNRSGSPPEQLGTAPSHRGRSLDDVLPLLSDTDHSTTDPSD
jgi:2-haloacid dehalogenase